MRGFYNNVVGEPHPQKSILRPKMGMVCLIENSKYCIRVVLRRKIYDIFCSKISSTFLLLWFQIFVLNCFDEFVISRVETSCTF